MSKSRLNLISQRKLTNIVVAITMFLSVDPFFVWPSFSGNAGPLLFKGMEVICFALLAASIPWRKIAFEKFLSAIAMVVLFLLLSLFTGVKAGTYLPLVSGNIITFSTFTLVTLCDDDLLVNSYSYFKNIYTVIIAYTLVIFVLVQIGVNIPYVVLQSAEEGRTAFSGQYYLNYCGNLIIKNRFIQYNRFTSVFTEPGVVGTLSAFFLAADDLQIKKDKKNIIIFVAGILSFSFAFIVLLAIYYVLQCLRKGAYKVVIGFFVLAISYTVFMNMEFDNHFLSSLQMRMAFSEEALTQNSRMTDIAQAGYENLFLNGGWKTVLLGYGNSPMAPGKTYNIWQGTASYKRQLFQYGFLGFGCYILWLILAPWYCFKGTNRTANQRLGAFIVVFLASVYQRPYLTTLFFIYLLMASSAHTVYDETYRGFTTVKENGKKVIHNET